MSNVSSFNQTLQGKKKDSRFAFIVDFIFCFFVESGGQMISFDNFPLWYQICGSIELTVNTGKLCSPKK